MSSDSFSPLLPGRRPENETGLDREIVQRTGPGAAAAILLYGASGAHPGGAAAQRGGQAPEL